MGDALDVKTTLEIPDALFRNAKAVAAREGRSLKDFVQEALAEKLARRNGSNHGDKPWMVLAGGVKQPPAERRRFEKRVEEAFEQIEDVDQM